MNKILVVNKEKGYTSQQVISKIKRILHVDKIGHAGTLDPIATGVLVVLLNQATKLSDYLMSNIKEYECEIIVGSSTTTEDCTGETIHQQPVSMLMNVDSVLASLVGEQMQTPPMYSSVHHEGKKLYELARKGMVVERESRTIQVYDIERVSDIIYENEMARFSFWVKVSKGTYIRTLCTEIGHRLGYPAHMNALNRIASGIMRINESYSLSQIEAGQYETIDMLTAMQMFPIFELDETQVIDVKNGKTMQWNSEEPIIVFSFHHALIGIYEKYDTIYKARRIWN